MIDLDAIDRECDVFCRYLTGRSPSEYVRVKYRSFHQSHSAAEFQFASFDATLLAVARRNPLSTLIADAYASAIRPAGALRKKLVVLVAILETCAPDELAIDDPGSFAGLHSWFVMGTAVAGGLAVLIAAMMILGPCHILTAATVRPQVTTSS